MNIYEKLNTLQVGLKAPKSNYNGFGKYNYRTCEQILEAAKPLLEKTKSAIVLQDEPVMVGDRFYIKATAKLVDAENAGECVEASAFAREAEEKKGMDPAQVTGAASSYARKYALAGLFALDGAEDPDATNTHGKKPTTTTKASARKSTPAKDNPNGQVENSRVEKLISFSEGKGVSANALQDICTEQFNKSLWNLTNNEFNQLYKRVNSAA